MGPLAAGRRLRDRSRSRRCDPSERVARRLDPGVRRVHDPPGRCPPGAPPVARPQVRGPRRALTIWSSAGRRAVLGAPSAAGPRRLLAGHGDAVALLGRDETVVVVGAEVELDHGRGATRRLHCGATDHRAPGSGRHHPRRVSANRQLAHARGPGSARRPRPRGRSAPGPRPAGLPLTGARCSGSRGARSRCRSPAPCERPGGSGGSNWGRTGASRPS